MKLLRPLLLSLALHLLLMLWFGHSALFSRSKVQIVELTSLPAPVHLRIDSSPTPAEDKDKSNPAGQPGLGTVRRKAQKRKSNTSSVTRTTSQARIAVPEAPAHPQGIPRYLLPDIYPALAAKDWSADSWEDDPLNKRPAVDSKSSEHELNNLGKTTPAAVGVGKLLASEMRINLEKLRFESRDVVRFELQRASKCRLSITAWQSNDLLMGALVFESLRKNPSVLQDLCNTNLDSVVVDVRFKSGALFSPNEQTRTKEQISWNGNILGIEIEQPDVGEIWGTLVNIEPETMNPSLNILGLAALPFRSMIEQRDTKDQKEMLKRSFAYSNPEKVRGFVLIDR